MVINNMVLRFRKDKEGNRTFWRNSWCEFYPSFSLPNISVKAYDNELKLSFLLLLIWGKIYLTIPVKIRNFGEYSMYFYPLGFSIPSTFCMNVNGKYHSWDLPWSYDWIRTSYLRKDGNWEIENRKTSKDCYDFKKWESILWSDNYVYTYVLDNEKTYKDNEGLRYFKDKREGNTNKQIVNALVTVEEREWRQKWLKWTSWGNKVSRDINVQFSEEVGSRAGSWKGGCLGCSYTMRKNETPLDTLRRMENERKFK